MGDPCNQALVGQVKIERVSELAITFLTRSGSLSGDASECLLRSFTVPRAEVYTAPIQGAPASVVLATGAIGPMYLSRAGWEIRSADGYPIFGKDSALFKYPDCAALAPRLVTRLGVVPASIALRGHLEGANGLVELELLGPDAAPAQALTWTAVDYLDVRLTPQGARRLGLGDATAAKIWPVAFRVRGAPSIDLAVSGTVDLLDHQVADVTQAIAYAKPGQPIHLVLTQAGVNAFHLTPQVVAELVGPPVPAAAPCLSCAAAAAAR